MTMTMQVRIDLERTETDDNGSDGITYWFAYSGTPFGLVRGKLDNDGDTEPDCWVDSDGAPGQYIPPAVKRLAISML